MLIFISVDFSAPEMFIAGFKSHHTGPKNLIFSRKITH